MTTNFDSIEKTEYIHAISNQEDEEKRLLSQAEISKPFLWENIDLKKHILALTSPFLEVGCGIGAQTSHLLEALPSGSFVVGIDVDPKQIERACARAQNDSLLANHCSYKIMNACCIDYPENHFSGAYACWVLEHLSEKQALAALKEIRRVVKPGGKIIINEIHMQPDRGIIMKDKNGKFPPYCFKFLEQMIESQKEKLGNPNWGDAINMKHFLEQAGFRNFTVKTKTMAYREKSQDLRDSIDDGIKLFECILPILIKEKRFTEEEFLNVLHELQGLMVLEWGYGQAKITVH